MAVDDITADILGRTDPPVANGLITWRYHQLALGMSERIGGLATWCAFGTWASRTAGASIRGEGIASSDALEAGGEPVDVHHPTIAAANDRVPFVPAVVDGSVIDRFVEDVAERVADMVWRGNRLVFSELGPAFTDFCESFTPGVRPEPATVERFLARRRAEHRAIELTSAFAHYCDALTEVDDRRRVQLVCLANLQTVLYEQVRLDHFIDEALEAPVDEMVGDLRRLINADRPLWQRVALRIILRHGLEPVVRLLVPAIQELSTRHLMTITIAARQPLRLSQDIPPAVPGQPFHPVELGAPRLVALEPFLTRRGSDGHLSGAQNWSQLDDRMDFISALFCSHLLLPDLLAPPFTADQVAALERGDLPGDLP